MGKDMNGFSDQKERLSTLVIGGAGYIGSHLVPQLLATGREVAILGRRPRPLGLPEGAEYIQGDFGQLDLLDSLLDRYREVIYLAYATAPNTSFKNPLDDLIQNLPPITQLFSEISKREIKLILVSSGGTVYGEATYLPINESHPTKPISPYGVTKLSIENYAHMYSVTHGLKYICVRPANAYGIGQRPFIGQGFISTAIASSMQNKQIYIFGQNGSVRDYIYVSDLAAGIVSLLTNGRLCEIYNIGSGIGMSNLEVIDAITPLMQDVGFEVKIVNIPERAFDVKANVLDIKKIKDETDWNTQINFIDGIRLTRDWLRSQVL